MVEVGVARDLEHRHPPRLPHVAQRGADAHRHPQPVARVRRRRCGRGHRPAQERAHELRVPLKPPVARTTPDPGIDQPALPVDFDFDPGHPPVADGQFLARTPVSASTPCQHRAAAPDQRQAAGRMSAASRSRQELVGDRAGPAPWTARMSAAGGSSPRRRSGRPTPGSSNENGFGLQRPPAAGSRPGTQGSSRDSARAGAGGAGCSPSRYSTISGPVRTSVSASAGSISASENGCRSASPFSGVSGMPWRAAIGLAGNPDDRA